MLSILGCCWLIAAGTAEGVGVSDVFVGSVFVLFSVANATATLGSVPLPFVAELIGVAEPLPFVPPLAVNEGAGAEILFFLLGAAPLAGRAPAGLIIQSVGLRISLARNSCK